jgi:hypothetical protein
VWAAHSLPRNEFYFPAAAVRARTLSCCNWLLTRNFFGSNSFYVTTGDAAAAAAAADDDDDDDDADTNLAPSAFQDRRVDKYKTFRIILSLNFASESKCFPTSPQQMESGHLSTLPSLPPSQAAAAE